MDPQAQGSSPTLSKTRRLSVLPLNRKQSSGQRTTHQVCVKNKMQGVDGGLVGWVPPACMMGGKAQHNRAGRSAVATAVKSLCIRAVHVVSHPYRWFRSNVRHALASTGVDQHYINPCRPLRHPIGEFGHGIHRYPACSTAGLQLKSIHSSILRSIRSQPAKSTRVLCPTSTRFAPPRPRPVHRPPRMWVRESERI